MTLNTPFTICLVTPNYNGVKYLRESIESVLGQNYPSLQYVVVDGASTDGSRLVAESYRSELTELLSEPDRGHADAINKGFALTDGEIMGWINSDDVLHPGCLAYIARVFQTHPDVEWITGRPSAMNDRGEMEFVGSSRPWSRLRFLCGDHRWIQQESTFWRRSLWERAGGQLDTQFVVANDFELWARFFRHADLYTVDRMLGCFRVRKGQRSVQGKAEYDREMRDVLKRELDQLEVDFRDAFGKLIPSRPRELAESERALFESQLGVLDPPIIRLENARQRSANSFSGGARYGVGLRMPEPISNLSPLRNRHKGERCIILGNGPSLNVTDLSLLEHENVFACNAVHLLFDRINWRPNYYTCVDAQVLPDRAGDIEAMLAENPEIVSFFPAEVQSHGGKRQRWKGRDFIPEGPNRYYFNEEPGTTDNLPLSMFSVDASVRVIQPHTVAITMMQLAAYMGFCELVLVGCDMRYVVQDSVRRESSADKEDPRLVSSFDDDPNHFDPRYFGAERKWHTPNPTLMREHFEIAKQALSKNGVKVRNATVGGDLHVFERLDLKEVLSLPPTGLDTARSQDRKKTTTDSNFAPFGRLSRLVQYWKPSLMRNLGFISGTAAVPAILFVAAILLPDWRVWLIIVSLFSTCLSISVVVAIKARRIILTTLDTMKVALSGKAEAELARQKLDLEIYSIHEALREIRIQLNGEKGDKS